MKVNIHSYSFDWDPGNSNKNKRSHDVNDWECEEVFFDENKVIMKDTLHSASENRHILLGKSKNGRLLYIVFTFRQDKLRVISARDVTKRKEINLYEKAN